MERGDYILPRPVAPPSLVVAANFVSPDERAYQLTEVVRMPPTGGAMHRYQYITVLRGDRHADFIVDLGPASRLGGDQFRILAMWEHSVAELQEMALEVRYGGKQAKNEIEPRNLVGDWVAWQEEKLLRRHRTSTFGPSGRVLR